MSPESLLMNEQWRDMLITTALQIHSGHGLIHGLLYFVHCELHSLWIKWTIQGSLCKVWIYTLNSTMRILCISMLCTNICMY